MGEEKCRRSSTHTTRCAIAATSPGSDGVPGRPPVPASAAPRAEISKGGQGQGWREGAGGTSGDEVEEVVLCGGEGRQEERRTDHALELQLPGGGRGSNPSRRRMGGGRGGGSCV